MRVVEARRRARRGEVKSGWSSKVESLSKKIYVYGQIGRQGQQEPDQTSFRSNRKSNFREDDHGHHCYRAGSKRALNKQQHKQYRFVHWCALRSFSKKGR